VAKANANGNVKANVNGNVEADAALAGAAA
jgi:hypothetical protein